jgi:zinc protease
MKNQLTLFLLVFFCTSIFAQPIPIDESVRMGVLENGMRYYIQHHEKPENRVEIRMAVKAGSVLEDEDQRGLAHFVEHMAFNGTENFEKNELVDYLESTGTRFGADLNAYTSFDETVYMLQARTDEAEMLDKGLLIFEDWAGGLMFDHEEIDKERGVVKSEWRSRLSPDQRMQQEYFPVLYHNSQYAQRLPIGSPEIIEHAPYDVVKRFYEDWYRPDLMAIVMVGDIDVDAMEQEIKTRFSKLENPAEPRERVRHRVPPHQETLISIPTDEEASFTSARMLIKHPHLEVNDIPSFRQSLLERLYNGMMNARLDELAQLPDPPYSFAFSGYGRDIGDIDRYSAFARTGEGEALIGFKAMFTEIERARRFGFLESELERQKAEILSATESAVKEQDKTQSSRLAMRYVYHFLQDNPIPSPQARLDLYQEFLPTVTVEEINALSERWFTKSNRVVVLSGPNKKDAPMPDKSDVLAAISEVENMTLSPYEDDVLDEPLFDRNLSPGTIADIVSLESIGVEEWQLSNGVKVVVKQTNFKNDEVLMRASSEGGHSIYDDSVYPSARFASGVVNESGIGHFDNIQLEKKLSGKIVSVGPFIGENYEGFYGDASPEDLEVLFQLVYLYFTDPREDENAYRSFVSKQENVFKNLLSNPDYYFSDFVTKLKTNNHPRRGFPTSEDLQNMDYKEALRIYKDRFADASDFTFYFVGSFDIDQLKNYATTYLATLPSTNREETWKDVGAVYQDGVINKSIEKGKAPKTQIDLTFHGEFDYSPKNEYLFNSMLAALRIKLREAMREDKGGVYGVRVSGNASKIPRQEYSITISFNAEPDRTDELVTTAIDVVKKYQSQTFDEEVIQKVAETQTQETVKNMQENWYWMRQLQNAYQEGLDPTNISEEKLKERQKDLTPETLFQAAQQYFDWENYFKIIMSPAEKVEG